MKNATIIAMPSIICFPSASEISLKSAIILASSSLVVGTSITPFRLGQTYSHFDTSEIICHKIYYPHPENQNCDRILEFTGYVGPMKNRSNLSDIQELAQSMRSHQNILYRSMCTPPSIDPRSQLGRPCTYRRFCSNLSLPGVTRRDPPTNPP